MSFLSNKEEKYNLNYCVLLFYIQNLLLLFETKLLKLSYIFNEQNKEQQYTHLESKWLRKKINTALLITVIIWQIWSSCPWIKVTQGQKKFRRSPGLQRQFHLTNQALYDSRSCWAKHSEWQKDRQEEKASARGNVQRAVCQNSAWPLTQSRGTLIRNQTSERWGVCSSKGDSYYRSIT